MYKVNFGEYHLKEGKSYEVYDIMLYILCIFLYETKQIPVFLGLCHNLQKRYQSEKSAHFQILERGKK